MPRPTTLPAGAAVDCPRDHPLTRCFLHRPGFPGDHGLVDIRLPAVHFTVRRNARPRRANTRSPFFKHSVSTCSVLPSGRIRSAVSGISLASSCSAPDAWRTLLISSQWPRSLISISVTSSQKKVSPSRMKKARNKPVNSSQVGSLPLL
jgi:hypothetical protein